MDNNNHSKDTVAVRLATAHFQVDSAIEKIVRILAPGREEDPSEPIKLLEVNQDTPKQGIMPILFGPDASWGIDYPSIIVEVRPEEYQEIQHKKLNLPNGWVLDREIERSGNNGQ